MIEELLPKAKQEALALLQKPQYRSALADKIITEEELVYVALFELTRKETYQPNIEGIIDRIWNEFSQATGTSPETAEERWGEIENRVINHYNAMQYHFGAYADKFTETEQ